jgi:SAM-dependent methyltransferase
MMQLWPIAKGAATWIPFLYSARRGRTGGTSNARYCYSVWLRHLVRMHDAGLSVGPRSVAELGPGDSLGIGLAALLGGACRLQAFDVVRYAATPSDRRVLRELVELFRGRAGIPDDAEFPGVYPRLEDYRFPSGLWKPDELEANLAPARIASIEQALDRDEGPIRISYVVPWHSADGRTCGSVDLIYSQAVLEHVEDIRSTYASLSRWLSPGGCMSHVIDFRSHGITRGWDGHLQYPEMLWRVVRGRRPYLLNRKSPLDHIAGLEAAGFAIRSVDRLRKGPTVPDNDLASAFRHWSSDDRSTCTMHVIADMPVADASGTHGGSER